VKRVILLFLLLVAAPILLAQRIVSGPVIVNNTTDSGATQLLFTFIQQVVGNQTNEAATCGTRTVATTCIVPGTVATGDLALVQVIMGNVVTLTSAGTLGTYVPLGNLNTDGITATSSTYKTQYGYIYPTTSTTNPTFTFSAAHGGVTVSITDCSTGTAPTLDAYGSLAAVSGSPYSGPTEGTTGTSECMSVMGTGGVATVSSVTAISSPWNTNQALVAQFYTGLGNSNNGFSSLVGGTYSTPSFTATGNTNANTQSIVFEVGGTGAKDWLLMDSHGGTASNVPLQADLNSSSYGYIGGGNASRSPAWNGVTGGATGLTYAAPTCATPPTVPSKHYAWGGTTTTGAHALILSWATGSATHGGIPYAPPNGTRKISDGEWVCTTIPNAENSGTQYSLGDDTNGTDEINFLIRPNGGSSLPVHLECNASDQGTVFSIQPNTIYWFTKQMISTVSGTNTASIYASDGVTLLGSLTCTNTTAADIASAGSPGISGGETQAAGHVIEFGAWLIDRTGAKFPLLPGS
jgi:hypothetical protein